MAKTLLTACLIAALELPTLAVFSDGASTAMVGCSCREGACVCLYKGRSVSDPDGVACHSREAALIRASFASCDGEKKAATATERGYVPSPPFLTHLSLHVLLMLSSTVDELLPGFQQPESPPPRPL
ncbi:MAG: hypothetical protein ACE5JI_02890 [Acidobacteriota bacterium]